VNFSLSLHACALRGLSSQGMPHGCDVSGRELFLRVSSCTAMKRVSGGLTPPSPIHRLPLGLHPPLLLQRPRGSHLKNAKRVGLFYPAVTICD
jgi:hypothetical protein